MFAVDEESSQGAEGLWQRARALGRKPRRPPIPAPRRYGARWLVLSRLPPGLWASDDRSVKAFEDEGVTAALRAYYSEEDFLTGPRQPSFRCW